MTHARGMGLFYERMTTVLGLIGVAIFIPTIMGIAAGMTWVVVKFSPGKAFPKSPPSS